MNESATHGAGCPATPWMRMLDDQPLHRGTVNRVTPIRVAILCDLAEEQWPSMDLVGEMLIEHLQRFHSSTVEAVRIRPRFVRRFSRFGATSRLAANADRLLNRMVDYPRHVRRVSANFDLFHLVDHSYSHLVHKLPSGRVIVTCHDLHTFRCLLEQDSEPRSLPFRLMTSRILSGLQKTSRIACVSETTRNELLHYRLVEPQRTVVIPNGVAPVYSPMPEPTSDRKAARLLGSNTDVTELLSVGSTVPRKRIDVLLRVFAAIYGRHRNLRLIRVGGRLNASQTDLAQRLGIRSSIVELPFLDGRTLAAVYRRASLVLCPSEAEGFGLPLLESMACGTPVVASNLSVLREVGGRAALYAAVGDVPQWTDAVLDLLSERRELAAGRRRACVEQAKLFSWPKVAARTAELYRAGFASSFDH